MRCTRARRWISDFIDGHLDADKKAALQKHLESCPECQQVLEDFKNITEKAHDLEEVSPSDQSWFRIKSRIGERTETVQAPALEKRSLFDFMKVQPNLKYALSAVLLLVIVSGGVILGLRYGKGIFGSMDPQQYTLSKLREAERHYQAAIRALDQAVSTQKGRLDPGVARIFQANLEIIDLSINACRKAVLTHPDNLEARNYLLYAYDVKLKLLDEMAAVKSASSPERGTGKTL
jgi:anti-sigma factor RsiW